MLKSIFLYFLLQNLMTFCSSENDKNKDEILKKAKKGEIQFLKPEDLNPEVMYKDLYKKRNIKEDNKFEYIKPKKRFFDSLRFWQNNQNQVKYNFSKFSSIIPEDLFLIIEGFKNNSILLNRLILYGPPGNGKSSLAHEICKEINAEFIEISGPSIVNKFQGSGAQNISKAFEQAFEVLKFNRKVIIFIDEIDSIAPKFNDDERYHDHKAALQTLWLNLDKIKNNSKIFVICATNKFESLDKAFITRFDNNIIELKNPDENARLDIIEYYLNEFKKTTNKSINLDESFIQYLLKKTEGLSIRSIEGVIRMIYEKTLKTDGIIDYTYAKNTIDKQRKIAFVQDNKKDKNRLLDATNYISLILSISLNAILLYNHYKEHKEKQTLLFKAKKIATEASTFLGPFATVASIIYTISIFFKKV